MLFTIADLHLSLGTDKPMDIFSGWSDYTSRIENNWNKTVSNDDTVVIAGDISWALKLKDSKSDFDFINKLNGKKIILKGNHDLWWETATKMKNFFAENNFNTISILHNNAYFVDGIAIAGSRGWFFDDGEDKKILNREVGRLRTSIEEAEKFGEKPIVFLHYPPIYKDSVCNEILNLLKEKDINRCYYGHIHGAGKQYAYIGKYDNIDFNLISCDSMDFTPKLVLKD
jgi:predicted phosphohydrolase